MITMTFTQRTLYLSNSQRKRNKTFPKTFLYETFVGTSKKKSQSNYPKNYGGNFQKYSQKYSQHIIKKKLKKFPDECATNIHKKIP